jgi:AcrR family transcriptional regulator
LVLERVAIEAGYTRGALYHLFANKEALALAVVNWVDETWNAEVGQLAADEVDPVDALLAMARGHAIYCRRDVARVMMTLRVEFAGQDHPVGRALTEIFARLVADCAGRITAGRESGTISPGPPPRQMALAYFGALEGLVSLLAGHAPFDVELADRAVRGVLGLPPAPITTNSHSAGASAPPTDTFMEDQR